VDVDVFHRQWPRAALLHCAVFDARLRQLHPRRRLAADPSRDMERSQVPGISRQADECRASARLRQLRVTLEPVSAPVLGPAPVFGPLVSVIIPALNEEQTIGEVVRGLASPLVREIIVVDNGSTDRTATEASMAGARVIAEPRRGYGRACASGVLAASPQSKVLVFLDGDGSDVTSEIESIAGPVCEGRYDFVIGSRTRGQHEAGSLLASQIFAGWLAGLLIRLGYGVRYTDMGPFRAISRRALAGLQMNEMTYGWNLEMQMKAAHGGLRILEVPVNYRMRQGGVSKVAGSVRGSFKAGVRIIKVFIAIAFASAR
jgi:Glycosyl transferase family 2